MNSAVARILVIGLAAAVLQELVMSRVSIFGVHGDLLLGMAIVVGALGGPERGAMAGLFAGVVADSLYGTALGPATIVYTLVAFAVGALSDDTTDYSWVVSFTTFVGSVVGVFAFVIASSVIGDFSASTAQVIAVALVTGMVNGLFAPFAARALRNVLTRGSTAAW